MTFLKSKHTVHFLGRVTRNGYRDLLYYIDKPNFIQDEVNIFCDNVMKERRNEGKERREWLEETIMLWDNVIKNIFTLVLKVFYFWGV